MSDVVKAEVQAVRDLKRGVSRYADRLRDVATDARREAQAAEQGARESVEAQRLRVTKRESEVRRAKEALARCPEERRREFEQAARSAERQATLARQDLDRARKAEQAVAAAMGDLRKVICSVESVVADHSSAATAALATLDTKLSEITSGGVAAFARGALVTLGVAAEVATTVVDGATLIGYVSQ